MIVGAAAFYLPIAQCFTLNPFFGMSHPAVLCCCGLLAAAPRQCLHSGLQFLESTQLVNTRSCNRKVSDAESVPEVKFCQTEGKRASTSAIPRLSLPQRLVVL